MLNRIFTLYALIQSTCVQNVLMQDFDARDISTCSKQCEYGDRKLMCDNKNCTAIPDLYTEAYWAKEVYLSSNSITNITYINSISYLQKLFLANNKISHIQEEAFKDQPYLNTLNLAGNQLKELNETYFRGLTGLELLDLSRNQLTSVEADIFYLNMRGLTTLNLGDNMIKRIQHNAFTDMPSLQFLHLQDNLLTGIEANHFLGLGELESLNLKANFIKALPKKVFYECGKMKELDLRSNLISMIAESAFEGLQSLSVLHLTHNKLPNVTNHMFTDLTQLQALYLDGNPINYIGPGALPKSLTEISLRHLSQLPRLSNKTFTELSELTTVDISSNKQLTVIESGAFQDDSIGNRSTKVVTLNLFNNSLMTLQRSLLNWSVVDEPILAGNDWVCDCNMAWVVMDDYFSTDIQKEIVCSHPHHLRGQSVNKVDFTQFSCSFFQVHRYEVELGLILFVTVLFLMLAGFLLYHFRHTVMPCCYVIPGKYTTMYNAVNNTDDDERVKLKWDSSSGSAPKKESREIVEHGPTPV